MTDYRCYFLDREEHVRGVFDHLVCSNDGEAARVAATLLSDKCQREERCRYDAVEVWDRTRKVARRAKIYHVG